MQGHAGRREAALALLIVDKQLPHLVQFLLMNIKRVKGHNLRSFGKKSPFFGTPCIVCCIVFVSAIYSYPLLAIAAIWQIFGIQ